MESQIEELIDKYWKGETSLEEEQIVKNHFKSNPALTNESNYFRALKNKKSVTFDGQAIKRRRSTKWISAAATVAIGVMTAFLVINDAKKDPFAIDDPEQAFEATKKALLMIGAELKDGQSYTMELTKINKAKNELEETETL
ncbi:MAG: hypothetical protein AB8B73_01750 [Ekhidna sp.]